ncbi:four-carbon acid sugar kinase family protein [Shouchella sp. 1P09AA]|uniref:four-carbon acid sugar kinase family protein n=1 Tax=unclassified Shouchella TaxID=2893065 RepID=UPI0039A3B633
MNLAIIADDLTGANDSGVQLAKYGLKTAVFFKEDKRYLGDNDAVVFDTDSRAIRSHEAEKAVSSVTKFLLKQGVTTIYKKIDSTMRGNVGAELVGLQKEYKQDFIIVAPGYPTNGRTVVDGHHYLNGRKLSETEIANDPVTPVLESHLPTLLGEQLRTEVGLITTSELRDSSLFHDKLNQFKEDQTVYIVIDSETDEDLQLLLKEVKRTPFKVGLVGSAGLANHLPTHYGLEQKTNDFQVTDRKKAILTVVGSVNVQSRKQLHQLLENKKVEAIEVASFKAVSDDKTRQTEIERVYCTAKKLAFEGHDVVLYSAGEKSDIEHARRVGNLHGYTYSETSSEIVHMMGEISARLLKAKLFQGVVMTGGDTAKKICEHWRVTGFQLYDELEVGVPISTFIGVKGLFAITKAGGFGKENVLIDSIDKLKGEKK